MKDPRKRIRTLYSILKIISLISSVLGAYIVYSFYDLNHPYISYLIFIMFTLVGSLPALMKLISPKYTKDAFYTAYLNDNDLPSLVLKNDVKKLEFKIDDDESSFQIFKKSFLNAFRAIKLFYLNWLHSKNIFLSFSCKFFTLALFCFVCVKISTYYQWNNYSNTDFKDYFLAVFATAGAMEVGNRISKINK